MIQRRNRSLLRIWNMSYALGLGVILILLIGLYAFVDRAIEDLVVRTNAVHGETIGRRIADEVTEMQDIAFRISMDGRLVSYDTDPLENTRLLVRELKRYALMNSWIESIAICLPGFDTVISTEGRSTMSVYRQQERELRGIDLSAAWESGDASFLYPESDENELPVPVIRYLCRKDIRYPRREDCILIHIDRTAVNTYLEQFGSMTGNTVSIIDAFGMPLWQHHIAEGDAAGHIEQKFTLDALGWQIIVSTPRRRYFARINTVRGISLGVLSVIIIAYFSLARYFSRKNYDPVARLMARLSTYEATAEGNEYDQINASLSTMNRQMDQYRKAVHEGIFLSIIKGEFLAEDSGLKELEIGEMNPGTAVLVTFIQPPGDRRQERMVRALTLRDEIDSGGKALISAVSSDVTWVLFPVSKESTAVLDDTLKSIIDRFADWRLSAVVSRPLQRISDIPRLAEECLAGTMMSGIDEYGYIMQIGNEELSNESYSIPQSSEERITGGILQGKRTVVRDELTRLIYGNRRARIAPGMNFVFLSSLLALVLKPLQHSRVADSGIQEIIDEKVRLFLGESAVSARAEVLYSISEDLCDYFTDRQTLRNQELLVKLQDYINNHAYDSSICHTMIADAMGMNSKYLARFFQEHTGETISRRITAIRMQQARTLLLEGLSVQDVSTSVGYSGPIPFIRVFKKREGLSPGKYRHEKTKSHSW